MTVVFKGIAMFKILSIVATVAALAVSLGSVRLPHAVMADGKPLPAGTYQVQLTEEVPKPAVGQTADSEKWVEFMQGGKVAGREVVSIVPASEMKDLMPGPDSGKAPGSGAKVEMLKGNDYLRVWIARNGVNYLIHLPAA